MSSAYNVFKKNIYIYENYNRGIWWSAFKKSCLRPERRLEGKYEDLNPNTQYPHTAGCDSAHFHSQCSYETSQAEIKFLESQGPAGLQYAVLNNEFLS